MSTEKNIILQQFNGVDYDILYPKTLAEQVNVNSSIANLFGLSENEANISNIINNIYYNINGTDSKLYQWNRWKFTEKRTALSSNYQVDIEKNTIYSSISPTMEISKDGTASLINPKLTGFTKTTGTPKNSGVGRNNYASQFEGYYSGVTLKTVKYYFGPEAHWGISSTSARTYVTGFSDVYVVNIVKTSEVVTSTNPNAYTISDSPDAEGWYYEKLPDIQMYPPLGRFISSSYTGTGVYGSSNRNTIVLPFNPKMVIISQNDSLYLGILVNSSPTGTIILSGSSDNTSKATVTWGDKQVSWYGPSITSQLNTNGKTYNYIALGNL